MNNFQAQQGHDWSVNSVHWYNCCIFSWHLNVCLKNFCQSHNQKLVRERQVMSKVLLFYCLTKNVLLVALGILWLKTLGSGSIFELFWNLFHNNWKSPIRLPILKEDC